MSPNAQVAVASSSRQQTFVDTWESWKMIVLKHAGEEVGVISLGPFLASTKMVRCAKTTPMIIEAEEAARLISWPLLVAQGPTAFAMTMEMWRHQ